MAVTAAITVAAAAAPAFAATTTTPAQGNSRSALTLLELSLAGHTVTAGTLEAVATNASSRVAKLVVTPVAIDGAAKGQQTITPSNAPATVPSTAQTVSVPNLLSVTGPTLSLDAKSSPTDVLTTAALKALGSIDLKPAGAVDLPINLQTASLTDLAEVTSSQSQAEKTVTVGSLSLPSINQLLSGLGVNLTALLGQLTQANLDALNGLVSSNTLAALNSAVDTAQAALASAPDTLAGATAALTAANSQLSSANTALTAANSAWTTAFGAINTALLPAGVSSTLTPAVFQALSPALQTTVDALSPANLATLAQTAVDAQTAVTAAQTLVTAVNALVDALQALVNAVLNAVTTNGDPLAALGNISVTTKAVATNTSATPTASAKVGTVNILGTAASVASLTSTLNSVTSTLAGVLNSVTGVSFTAPAISIGTPHTSTSTQGKTHKATASITGLTLTLPTIQLPTALSTITSSLPGATIANGLVSVLGGSLKVAELSESVDHTPGTTSSTGTPSTAKAPKPSSGPGLANTGMSSIVPAIAAVLVMASLAVLHRRRRTDEV